MCRGLATTAATVTTGRRTRAQKTGRHGEHFRSKSPETVSTRFQGAIDRLAPKGTQAMSSGQTTAELVSAADHTNSISGRHLSPGTSSGKVSGTRCGYTRIHFDDVEYPSSGSCHGCFKRVRHDGSPFGSRARSPDAVTASWKSQTQGGRQNCKRKRR